jgi:hypothetical protein
MHRDEKTDRVDQQPVTKQPDDIIADNVIRLSNLLHPMIAPE